MITSHNNKYVFVVEKQLDFEGHTINHNSISSNGFHCSISTTISFFNAVMEYKKKKKTKKNHKIIRGIT